MGNQDSQDNTSMALRDVDGRKLGEVGRTKRESLRQEFFTRKKIGEGIRQRPRDCGLTDEMAPNDNTHSKVVMEAQRKK